MKKIILSLAFLFAVLIINSCSEGDTVSPDAFNHKLVKMVGKHTNYEGTITRNYNFEYNDNYIIVANVVEKDFTLSANYTYNEGLISNVKVESIGEGKISITNLSYQYQNGKLIKIIGVEGGNIIYQADYKYNGNSLSEIIGIKFNGDLKTDSTFSSDFIGGRPGLFKRFRFYDKEQFRLIQNLKFVYQNGNMVEQYTWNNEKNKWDIELKRTFDNNKRAAFYEIKEFFLTIQTIYPYIQNNYDKNLFIKDEYFNNYCDGVTNDEPILKELTNYTSKYNIVGLMEELTSQDVVFCGQRNILSSVFNLTWESKPY